MRFKLYHIFAVTILMMVSCSYQQHYPQELVLADSALMQGHYHVADSLLDNFGQRASDGDAVAMYYRLLLLERAFMRGQLGEQHLAEIDSLCHYFELKEQEKYARALLFSGRLLYRLENYPEALEALLKSFDIAQQLNENRLLCVIYRVRGDLYFAQGMLNDCVPDYVQYYRLASANNDTLRMAYAASDMTIVYTIKDNYDSAVYYCQQAIDLGQTQSESAEIVPNSLFDLADLYIQAEEWEKAATVMHHDSLFDGNWAYWHYGQEHTDSAIYYFEKTLGRYKWAGEVEALTILAQLERKRGHVEAAMDYYDRLAAAEDSLREQQKAEATLRMNAQYNYASITRQRDALEQRNKDMAQLLWMTVGAAVAVIAIGALLWRSYRQRKEQEATQLRLAQKEMENSFELSRQQLKENKAQQEMLLQQLAEARQQNNQQLAERLQMETNALDSKRRSIEAQQQLREQRRKDFVASALYERLKSPDTDGNRHLSEAEWQQLKDALDGIYNLTPRLLSLARFSEIELRVCCLLKLQVPPADIAFLISRSKSAVSLARKRMYYKATGRSGKAEDFDLFIAGM